MDLLPSPQKTNINNGNFKITSDSKIILDTSCDHQDLDSARMLQQEIIKKTGIKLPLTRTFNPTEKSLYLLKEDKEDNNEGYTLKITPAGIKIKGYSHAGLFYGIQTLRQLIRKQGMKLKAIDIEDYPSFSHRGFYHDITRGKVPTLKTLMELVDKLSFYKINQLQLYIEHSFAFSGHSEIWAGNDPLTPEEILYLDEYCHKRHIELIPSLATFGHLYHALSSDSFHHLCELEGSTNPSFSWIERMRHHTLAVSRIESIEFVEKMLSEFVPLFTSDKFNICGDETFDLGQGKSRKLKEEVGEGKLYVDFLKKIIKSVKKYGKQVMFWGDIILKYPEYIDELPDDVICLNWNYGPDPDEERTRIIAESGIEQYVCPGVSGWNNLMNDHDTAFANIRKMVGHGVKYHASGVLNTDWGDFGHINLLANSLPGMIYGASLSWNPDLEDKPGDIDKLISHLEFRDSSGEIVGFLRKLSRQEYVNWGLITFWREGSLLKRINDKSVDKALDRLKEISPHNLKKAYHTALELGERIYEIAIKTKETDNIAYREFSVSAKGIALMQALALIIKKYDFQEFVGGLLLTPDELAVSIEYWLEDYIYTWRERNKESELGRIKESVKDICHYLRGL